MKKNLLLFIMFFCSSFLISCSDNTQSNTFFIHSAYFDSEKEGVSVIFLLEKLDKEENEYFTAAYSVPNIKAAAKKVMSEYKECYFATCDLYFISTSARYDFLSNIAKDICDSNIYPTTGNVLCIDAKTATDFMERIKDSEDTANIKKSTSKSKVNIVSFFAKYCSGKPVTTDVISIKNGKIKNDTIATFIKDRKAVLHDKSKR